VRATSGAQKNIKSRFWRYALGHKAANVRFGSITDIEASWRNVRSTPKSQVCTQDLSAWTSVIFRRASSTSDNPAVSLKATSPSVTNSGRPVANEPDDAPIAAAIVAARANLLMAKRIEDPIPWDQFDKNYLQLR
jgi:hypothetical protein